MLILFAMHFISLLSFYLSLFPLSCWASAPPLIKAREITHLYGVVASINPDIPGFFPCNHVQLIHIAVAMEHTRAMAQAAATALSVANSEHSPSYYM